MKKATVLLLFLFLITSCWETTDTNVSQNTPTLSPNTEIVETSKTEPNPPAWSDVLEQISDATAAIWSDSENQLTKLNAPYVNPKWDVDMVIEYKLDLEGKITEISTSASTYDLWKFNWKLDPVLWKTLEEASEMYFSGSSLTTEAFQSALKKEITKS